MSKPDKISIETKKGARYYGEGAYSSTGWKSWTKDLLLIGAASKDREGRQRQRRQTKTEKAGGQSPYRESARNTTGWHSGLLQYLSVFNPVKWCLC